MINLSENISKKETKIKDYILDRINTYYSSASYEILRNRIYNLNSAIDLDNSESQSSRLNKNNMTVKAISPLAREVYSLKLASLSYNYRSNPLIMIEPDFDTPKESAYTMQKVLESNYRKTRFKESAFNKIKRAVARWGTCVVETSWCYEDYKWIPEWGVPKITTFDGMYGTVRQPMTGRPSFYTKHRVIHPLNYFQNASIADFIESDFQGHIETVTIAQLMAESKREDTNYIRKNLLKAIDEAKKASLENENMYHAIQRDEWNSIAIDLTKYQGKINIKGNEDSPVEYIAELVGDILIRLEINDYDRQIRTYTVFGTDPRHEFWWHNTEVEAQIGLSRYLDVIFQMGLDSAMQSLRNVVFTKAGEIDTESINWHIRNGGIVPLDIKGGTDIRSLIMPFQTRNTALNDIMTMGREIKEFGDRARPSNDFSRSPMQGGPQNKTLGAAQMMAAQGGMVEGDYLENFSYSLQHLGTIDITLLRQYLPHMFFVRDPREGMKIVDKKQIMGEYVPKIETAFNKNQQTRIMNLSNAISQVLNYMTSQKPEIQNINLKPIIREWVRSLDLGGIDVKEVYPEQDAMMLPQQAQGMPGGTINPATLQQQQQQQQMMPLMQM